MIVKNEQILFKLHFSPSTCSYLQFVVLQTLDIVAENPEKFRVVALAAGSNITLLADQVFIYDVIFCGTSCFVLVKMHLGYETTI